VIGTGGSMIEKVSIRTREVLDWATIGNARALRLDHRIGSLTPGKQADVILIRKDSLNMLSTQDPTQAVVWFAQNHDVDTVLVAGKPLKRHGELVRPDLARRKAELLASAERLTKVN
jgi:cytosine/adenosine deaminase-related metal-dependent hydrolase